MYICRLKKSDKYRDSVKQCFATLANGHVIKTCNPQINRTHYTQL